MNILVVDADELGTEIIRVILARSGHKNVQTAASDTEALRRIAYESHCLHLVITEWSAPNIEGHKICLAAAAREIPAIAFGSYYHQEYLLAAISAGASAYVPTPLNISKFVDRVDKLLAASTARVSSATGNQSEHSLLVAPALNLIDDSPVQQGHDMKQAFAK